MAPRLCLVVAIVLLAAGPAATADPKDAVKTAIRGAQQFLKETYKPGGQGPRFPGGGRPPGGVFPPILNDIAIVPFGVSMATGSACIAGLALIESGVPTDDATVANIANVARREALKTQGTYEVSLIIMFLDRVGSKNDEGLIQFMTLRLLTGQTENGMWGYVCFLKLDPVEERQLYAELVKEAKLVTPPSATPKPPKVEPKPRGDIDIGPGGAKKEAPPKPMDPEPKPETKPAPKREGLHPALEKFLRGGKAPGNDFFLGGGDHSNSQFATVALWCGRRHGVDVTAALRGLDKHYRNNMTPDGGWSYAQSATTSTASMTCAGLMGLGIGAGVLDGKGADFDGDKALVTGLKTLGTYLAEAEKGGAAPRRGEFEQSTDLAGNLYFLWSLERVGMLYGLSTIGKVDWYAWGSDVLVRSQARDGSWTDNGGHGVLVDVATSFGLLFLSKANLAKDLSSSLKGKVKDPGTSRLIGGGDLTKIIPKGTGPGTKPDTGTVKPKNDTPPPAGGDFEARAVRLAAALVNAADDDRDGLIATYRDTKGGEYTEALARAAVKLTGDAQAKTRAALAARLTRMKAATLNEFLRDESKEIRRGAAIACGTKGDKAHVPELVRLIADIEPAVVQAARAALKALTKEDYGPEVAATPAERTQAVLAWRKWLESQPK